MKSILALATTAILAIGAVAQDTFTINTPSNVVVCLPVLLSWTGGTPPYFLSVHDGNNPTGPAIEDLGSQDGTSFTWEVKLAAGTSVGLSLRDSTGLIVQSAVFSINSGPDTGCLDDPAATTGSATGTDTTAAATTAATTRPTSAAATSTRPANASTASGAAQTSNAASYQVAQIGAGGIIGAALIALLA
jgi:hypothetical protein